MYDAHSKRGSRDQEAYARGHPIRARILELYEEDAGRSLTAADLRPELEELPGATLAGVAYHLQVLRNVGLVRNVGD